MMSHMSVSHRHLTTPDTRTNIRHPVIISDPLMLVIRISLPSLRSVEHDLPLSLPVRTNQRTTTTGRNHLIPIERQHPIFSKRTQHTSIITRAKTLRRILNDRNPIPISDRHNLIHLIRHPI